MYCANSPLGCRLKSKDGYQEFLKTLNLYANDIISRIELVNMVQEIMARHNDIAVRFYCLLLHHLQPIKAWRNRKRTAQ